MEIKIFDKLNRRGLSPLIASVLTILFGVLMLGLVLGVVNPTFRRAQDSSVMSDAFQNLNLLNSAIKEVASESQESKRTVSVSVSGGEYSINETTDMLIFKYDPSQDMRLRGTKGDIHIEYGSVFLDFFNWYVDDAKAVPVWTNTTGNWTVSDFKYKGESGLAYHNLSTIENYKFSGKIYNTSGITGGQIFVLPTNPERLFGFWTFDNHTGDGVYDWSGNGNNGTLTNMNTAGNSTSGWQSSSDCKAGVSCLKFDGVNDYVDTGITTFSVQNYSYSLWVKVGEVKSIAENRGRLIEKDGGRSNLDVMYVASVPDKFQFAVKNTTGNSITAEASISQTEVWTHVVGVYNSITVAIYVNGELVEDNAHTGNREDIGATIKIGGDSAGSNYDFNGTIDEVKIWNVSLSSDEIAAEYELSAKKLLESGSQNVAAKTPNAAIVLANPDGVTSFDDIKVSRARKEQKLVIPYSKIDLNGTLRIAKGEHKVTIEHMGTNTTLGEPIIHITS